MPYDNADLATTAGGCSGGSLGAGPKGSFLGGILGGSDGICGDGTSTVITLGVDLLALNGILCLSLSDLGRLGGRGGRVEGLKTGAIIRPACIDGVRDAEVLAVSFDRAETEDMFEIVDAIDSVDSRLPRCPEGRLGGSDGDGCDEGVRGGSLGGGVGLVGFETAWPVRLMVGGGRTPFRPGPLGSLPMPFFKTAWSPKVGVTLMELLR